MLTVAVECRFGDLPAMHALLDTGAEWSVLPGSLALQLGYTAEADPDAPRYSTRMGDLQGRFERVQVTIPVEEGEEASIESTFYIAEKWDAPPVIGWRTCLDCLPFAIDPRQFEEYLYLGLMG